MKNLILMLFLILFCISFLEAEENILIGTYKNEQGEILIIGADFFKFGNDGTPNTLIFGKTSVNGPSDSLFRYFIKPTYLYKNDHASLINLWVQESDNLIIALYIFDYTAKDNLLSVGIWDSFIGKYSHKQYVKNK